MKRRRIWVGILAIVVLLFVFLSALFLIGGFSMKSGLLQSGTKSPLWRLKG